MTNKNRSKSFQKYAKAIGVDINENDNFLLSIANKGYNEELELNYSYEIYKGEIVYKNINTNVAYEVHPNYKIYRKIVSNYKEQITNISEASNNETTKNDKINIVKDDTQSQIDEIENKLKKLDLEYETEVDLFDHHVKETRGKFLNDDNLIKLSELTKKFEEIDNFNQEYKTLVKITQLHLEKLYDKLMKLKPIDTENSSDKEKEDNHLFQPEQCLINSDSEDEDDISLKVKCFNEKERNEYLDGILGSFLSSKSIGNL